MTRRQVLKQMREDLNIDWYKAYSEKRVGYQRVKLYGLLGNCFTREQDLKMIKNWLVEKGYTSVQASMHEWTAYKFNYGTTQREESIVLRFPYSDFK